MFRDWKSMLGVLAVFVLGAVAGLLIGFIFMRHRMTAMVKRGSPAYEQFLERRLSRGLNLDEGQRARFHEVLVANIEARKKLQMQIQPQVQSLNLATKEQIRSMLTPQQLVTLRRNMEEFRSRFGARGLGNPAANHSLNGNQLPEQTNAVPSEEN